MAKMYHHFRKKFAKDYEVLVNTSLSGDIKIGTIGQLKLGKKFNEEGLPDLQDLNIDDIPITQPGPSVDKVYFHQGDSGLSLDIKGEGDPAIRGLAEASAGFVASFGKKWSYVVAVKGLRYRALDLNEDFMAKLRGLAKAKKIRRGWEIVVGVWSATSVSWALSLRSEASLTVEASASINSIADLGIDWRVKSGQSSVEYMTPRHSDRGIPVFFRVATFRPNGKFKNYGLPSASGYAEEPIYEVLRPSDLYSYDE